MSGLADEYQSSGGLPRLVYVKSPAPERDPRLAEMLARVKEEGEVSYQHFSDAAELQQMVENDLAVLLSERFEMFRPGEGAADEGPLAGAVPVPPTPLLGRDQETAAVEELVVGKGVRPSWRCSATSRQPASIAAGASKPLLDEGQALTQELREEDLTGYDRLQLLLTVALVDNFLGQIRLSQGDNDTAARLFTDGLAVARRAQDGIPILVSLYDLALSSQAQGDLAAAAGHLKEGPAIAANAGDETSTTYYLEALAAVAAQQDNPCRAVRLLFAARWQLEASGSG